MNSLVGEQLCKYITRRPDKDCDQEKRVPVYGNLVFEDDCPQIIHSYPVAYKDYIIGREKTSHLKISFPTVSRLHCIISCEDGIPILINKSGLNGTYVDGEAVLTKTKLIDGVIIKIGVHSFRFDSVDSDDTVLEEKDQVMSPVKREKGNLKVTFENGVDSNHAEEPEALEEAKFSIGQEESIEKPEPIEEPEPEPEPESEPELKPEPEPEPQPEPGLELESEPEPKKKATKKAPVARKGRKKVVGSKKTAKVEPEEDHQETEKGSEAEKEPKKSFEELEKESESSSEIEPEPEPKSKQEEKLKQEPENGSEPEPEPELEPESEPEQKSETEQEQDDEQEAEQEPEQEQEQEPVTKPKQQPKQKVKRETKKEAKKEPKKEPKKETKKPTKKETKQESKAKSKSGTKSVPKADTNGEVKEELKPEVKRSTRNKKTFQDNNEPSAISDNTNKKPRRKATKSKLVDEDADKQEVTPPKKPAKPIEEENKRPTRVRKPKVFD